MAEAYDWHQLFGLCWADFFHGTPFIVEREKDLSIRQQLLDVVIIRPEGAVPPRRMPDGFEELAAHNLISFKSHREPLGTWPLCELIGHYVNYRKQAGPNMRELPPESDFRLFAVAARRPEGLAARVTFREEKPGVDTVDCLGLEVRIIVVNRLPKEEQNAMFFLYSAEQDLVRFGASHYQPHIVRFHLEVSGRGTNHHGRNIAGVRAEKAPRDGTRSGDQKSVSGRADASATDRGPVPRRGVEKLDA